MFVDGVLIPVRYLCTGATIAQVKVREVTYYHVELPRHDVMLAAVRRRLARRGDRMRRAA